MSLARSQKGVSIDQKTDRIYATISYAASRCFTYPDPSYYGLNALRPKSYPHKSTAFSSPNPPTAPVLTAFAPLLAVNPSQIALSKTGCGPYSCICYLIVAQIPHSRMHNGP